MAKDSQTAKDAFDENLRRAKGAIAELEQAIRAFEAGAAKNPRDYGYAGSMGHIAEVVEELTRGFSDSEVGRAERKAGWSPHA